MITIDQVSHRLRLVLPLLDLWLNEIGAHMHGKLSVTDEVHESLVAASLFFSFLVEPVMIQFRWVFLLQILDVRSSEDTFQFHHQLSDALVSLFLLDNGYSRGWNALSTDGLPLGGHMRVLDDTQDAVRAHQVRE